MLLAILAGILTLALIIVIVVVVARRRAKRQQGLVAASSSYKSIDTFGVAPEKQKTGFGLRGHAQVEKGDSATTAAGSMVEGRFIAMGVVAAAIFGSLSAKLFSMQILSSSYYENASASNLYRTLYTPAPRGIIYDYAGQPLVSNTSSYTVLAESDVADDPDVVQRLSTLLGIPRQVVRQRILDTSSGAQNTRVVQSGASLRNVAFISEHSSAFSGVSCEMRSQRDYPYGALAAHVLGYTSTASESDLADAGAGRNLQSGDIVGKSGVEYYYESLLAGDHGTRTVLTDASGDVQEVTSETDATRGNDIYLTLRGPVQSVADQIMRETLAPDGVLGKGWGTGAGLVCLDATNGEVVALSNFPTYSPASFIGGISQDVWNEFNTENSHYPLMNRVIQGAYPAASTFKAFTSMAALANGIANASSSYHCSGTWAGFGSSYAQKCWNSVGHGALDLAGGIANSCDVVFYEIAKGFYQSTTLPQTAMQDYIEQYGFGSKTGIDLSGEVEGRVPTPEWKAQYFKDAPEEAQWQGGDMTNMAIGQGYVLVTPLQIAAGYCGIARGEIWRPHVLKEVRNSLGETVLSYTPEVIARPTQDQANIDLVRQGLREVMTLNEYDTDYFGDVSYSISGKTGTAEVANKKDYAWFCCYAPSEDPKYVVACLVEEGVSNKLNAIPMCSAVLQAAMSYDEGTLSANAIDRLTATYTVSISESSSSDGSARGD